MGDSMETGQADPRQGPRLGARARAFLAREPLGSGVQEGVEKRNLLP